jgi:hypothetical protein
MLRKVTVTHHDVKTHHDVDVCWSCGWIGDVGQGDHHAQTAGEVPGYVWEPDEQ